MTPTSAFQLPAPLADIDPAGLVLLLDCDGVLAPIVDDPAAAAVPEGTVQLVRAAVAQTALTGVVTGRQLGRTRELVPVDGIWIAAMHGMHIVSPTGEEDIDPIAEAGREFVQVAAQTAQTVGWAYEDKGHSVTIHFRQRGALGQAVDPVMVKAQLQTVLNPLKVEIHDAKQVLEIKTRGVRTKSDGVTRLIVAAGEAAQTAIFVGDDLTDLDGFLGLDAARETNPALRIVKVAVGGDEAPAALVAAADVVLDGEADVQLMLAALLGR